MDEKEISIILNNQNELDKFKNVAYNSLIISSVDEINDYIK